MMSKFVVDLNEPQINLPPKADLSPPSASTPKKRRGCLRIFLISGTVLGVLLLIAAVAGFFYWQSVKSTPQYSLALLVDAARRDDKEKVAQIIDTEQVVNNFMPQITAKATELYGRNMPPQVISRVSQIITPLMPAIKEKAKAELPNFIREKTETVANVPYWVIALFAERGLEIKINGDTAQIKSKIPEKPLEMTMKREGNLWKIVEVKDEKLAQRIAEKIGQQLMILARKGNLRDAESQLKIENLGNLLKDLNDIFK